MASASSSCKYLLERIPPGSPQDLLLRTCTSCKNLLERNLEGSPQEPVYAILYRKMPQAQGLRTPRRRLCASLRNQNAPGHLTRAIICENYRKNAAPKIWKKSCHRLCASRRSQNAHGHRTRTILCENWQEKSWGSDGAPWSNPGLSYRKNPSVWTHCLGKNRATPETKRHSTPGKRPRKRKSITGTWCSYWNIKRLQKCKL